MDTKIYNPKLVIIVAAFAAFLATFNETYLNVAFSPIMASLAVDVNTVQWLATAYMLGAAVMVPVSAFTYRSFPTRPLFCVTTLFLIVGSIVGALAPTFAILLVGRIIQALGTGMLIPVGMNITLEAAPREKLGTYMGIMGAMTTLGPSLSVIVAGLLLSIAPWQLLLWVFAGLSLICFILGAIILRDIAHLTHPKFDVLSVILIGLGLIGVLYGVSTLFNGELMIPLITLGIGILLIVWFVWRQGHISDPLIDLRPLKVSAFTIGVIINMLSLITIFAMNILIPVFMQSAMGASSLVASLTLFPAILCSCILSPIAGRIYDKHGAGVLIPFGFGCICAFAILVAFFISTGNYLALALLYIPVIGGSALIIGPVQSFSLSRLSYELNPHGVTVMSTGFQIAGCIGSSVFVGLYSAVIAGSVGEGSDIAAASASGFLWSGLLVALTAAIGLLLGIRVRIFEKTPQETPVEIAAPAGAIKGQSAQPDNVLERIMKTDVYTLQATDQVVDAMDLFVTKSISGAPVVNSSGRIVGFVSDGDVFKLLSDQAPTFQTVWSFVQQQDEAEFNQTIQEVLSMSIMSIATKDVITVNADDGLGAICRVLTEHHLKKVPVIEDGEMVGIVNRSNISRYAVGEYLQEIHRP